jgi:hypothetical protein
MAAENKFDLVCAGTSSDLHGSVRTSGAYNHVFHIDLESAQFCMDECVSVGRISRFDPLLITLVDIPRHGGIANAQVASTTIDRRSGTLKISDIDVGALRALSVEAECQPRPFTPFPVTKF